MRHVIGAGVLAVLLAAAPAAQRAPSGAAAIETADMKTWLTHLASDQLEGRQVYSEGLGVAAGYIADHLRSWGVKPAGDNGTYFQTVKVRGVRTTSRASVTVTANGQTRTFKDGEGITFPRNMGARQTVSAPVHFAGYGLAVPSAGLDDYAGLDAKGKVIVYMPQSPASLPPDSARLLSGRTRSAVERGAAAVVTGAVMRGPGRGGSPPLPTAPAGRAGQPDNGDFTTAQRYDQPVPPAVTAEDEFLTFLFAGQKVTYDELKARAAKREPLPAFPLENVTVAFHVDADYQVVRSRQTRNVVGLLEGSDPTLRDTYVIFGAHYDHVGYREAGTAPAGGGDNPGGCTGQKRPTPRPDDYISNGADDDGSGTVTIMALARAFAQGPRPKRSLLFVWFSGEESGLLGSRYAADYPLVPNEKVVAMLNVDMVGRNRCDLESEANTVYLVGSDRISTELHNVSEDANASLAAPMTLDYEMNDPADPQSIYTRSDHYSYAAKGIPIIFYTTGLHKDYHFVTDEVDRIEFDKMTRIARLVYATGQRVANMDRPPARDNKGPRVGRGTGGKIGTE